MLRKVSSRFKCLINNERGLSTLGGLVLLIGFLMFLPVFSSVTALYTSYRDLNNIASSTVSMAKKTGGFNTEVMNLYNDLLNEYNIDRSRLDTSFFPGAMIKVNKREPLGIEMRYTMRFKIMQLDRTNLVISFELPIRQNTFSQRYFRPHEL